MLILDGSVTMTIGDETQELGPGGVCVVNRGVEHELHSAIGVTFIEALGPVPLDHIPDRERDLVLGDLAGPSTSNAERATSCGNLPVPQTPSPGPLRGQAATPPGAGIPFAGVTAIGATARGDLWGAWSFDPLVLGLAAVSIAFFLHGWSRLHRRRAALAPWTRIPLFCAGIAIVVLGIISPLDAVAEEYLQSAHMLQHVLIADLGVAARARRGARAALDVLPSARPARPARTGGAAAPHALVSAPPARRDPALDRRPRRLARTGPVRGRARPRCAAPDRASLVRPRRCARLDAADRPGRARTAERARAYRRRVRSCSGSASCSPTPSSSASSRTTPPTTSNPSGSSGCPRSRIRGSRAR